MGQTKRENPDELPGEVLKEWTEHFAETFDARDPRGELARVGVKLVVHAETRRSPRPRPGAWHAPSRKIELFACTPSQPDSELVATLAHEIWHMMADARRRASRQRTADLSAEDEAAAQKFAGTWLRQLGSGGVRCCAAALRALAVGR